MLGRYILAARVADGATGRIYEGRHPQTKARVAVKVLHEHVARDRIAVERFKREYETARELNSPYIVKVHEFGQSPDHSYFMTMEYLEGRELARAIPQDGGLLPLSRVLRTTCQIALALEHAHSFGFIHRDLKPENIFLSTGRGGTQVRVLDFGSVKLQMDTGNKLTALGTTLGSPYYMAPEQASGSSSVDQRSDVFALGAVLYEMLTSKIAFEAPTVALIVMKLLNHDPPPPSTWNRGIGLDVDAVVKRALAKEQQGRYDTARQLADGFISGLRLSGRCEEWAQTSEADIAEQLAAAVALARSQLSAKRAEVSGARAPAFNPRLKDTSVARLRDLTPMPIPRQPAATGSAGTVSTTKSSRVTASSTARRDSELPVQLPTSGVKPQWWIAGAVVVLAIALWVISSQ